MAEKFKDFLTKFNEEYKVSESNDHDTILTSIYYKNNPPVDSIDRLFALYLIEYHNELLEVDLKEICASKQLATEYFKSLSKDIVEDFNEIASYAYENYEREGLIPMEAYFNIIHIAKKGKEYTLNDSYANGGWFGAS